MWAKRFGSTGFDHGNAIAVDGSGNVFTSGYFNATVDFDPGAGTFTLATAGNADVFISKLDAAGNFVFAKRIGGAGNDIGNAIRLDAAGNVLTTGSFDGTVDFDPGAATVNLVSSGASTDIFISKLDASGNYVWAKRMGGSFTDRGYSSEADAGGNVYTTGYFQGNADFDPGAGTFTLSSSSNTEDIFVSKLDASGNFLWARAMGGAGNDQAISLALDASGNVHTTGWYQGVADFDPGPTTFTLNSPPGINDEIFVSKLNASGNFVWAKHMGGSTMDEGFSIDVDGSGNVYTTGGFTGTADFDPGPGTFTLTAPGIADDIFISKLDATGNFVCAGKLGGTGDDWGLAIAVDATGNIYSSGFFNGTGDFDPNAGIFNLTSAGGADAFISKLSPSCSGVGMNEIVASDFELKIFPNPGTGDFNLILHPANGFPNSITVEDLMGRNVLNFSNIYSYENKLDLVNTSGGIFIVKVLYTDKIFTKRIIKN